MPCSLFSTTHHSHNFPGRTNFNKEGRFYCAPKEFENNSDLRSTLDVWLNEIVIDQKSMNSPKVSRKDIILTLADKEGGAHVDSNYSRQYYDTIFNSGFEVFDANNVVQRIQNNYFIESLFEITHEFIRAVKEHEIIAGAHYEKAVKDLNLIEVSYLDNKGIRRNRYIHNSGKNILELIKVSYDYMAVCRYRLLFTTNFLFSKDGKIFGYRVIDNNDYSDLFFSISKEVHLYIKNQGKYCRILSDSDLYNLKSCRKYTFSQILRIIAPIDAKTQWEMQELYREYTDKA